MSENSLSFAAVYLSRLGNPIWQSRAFLESYFTNDPGQIAPLYVLHKGYAENQTDPALAELSQQQRERIRMLWISDEGLDLEAYSKACHLIEDYDYLLFMNSHCFIQCEDWAQHYQNALTETKGTALIGSTGCWEGYAKLGFKFPNAHVRTNAFLVRRETYVSAYKTPCLTKRESYFFESGPEGLSKQMLLSGAGLFIIDKRGQLFSPDNWISANTFRSGDQASLMISDNKTRRFQFYRYGRQQEMARRSWGQGNLNSKPYFMSWIPKRIWYRYLYFGYRWRFLADLRKRLFPPVR